jgi:hypothetical protein
MKRTVSALRKTAFVCGVLFVWAIAAEMDAVPRLMDLDWLRWQVCVMAGLLVLVSADRLTELRCRCCGSEHVLLRALFTRSREMLCRRCLQWETDTKVLEPASSAGVHDH